MNATKLIAAVIGVGVLYVATAAIMPSDQPSVASDSVQDRRAAQARDIGSDDIDKLYALIQQSRADLRDLRELAGLRGERAVERREQRGEHAEGGREGRGEHAEGGREGRGEHAEGGEHGGREVRGEHAEGGEHGGREGRGEHAESRERGEEGGRRLFKNEVWSDTRNGARLILLYNPSSQSFVGTVQNITRRTLSDVRVEVHLSNGVELGPTKRTDLRPGQRIAVELSAAGQEFRWWTTHPEHGSEEGHGPGHEEEEGGEHGEGGEGVGDSRPRDPELRPLYNQLLLLQHEIEMLARDLERRRR